MNGWTNVWLAWIACELTVLTVQFIIFLPQIAAR